VLNLEEVKRVLAMVTSLKALCDVDRSYGWGMRSGEVVRLQATTSTGAPGELLNACLPDCVSPTALASSGDRLRSRLRSCPDLAFGAR
jgi:hypothetical protein